MKIYIDRLTEKVVLQPSFSTYEIEVDDNFNISKKIETEVLKEDGTTEKEIKVINFNENVTEFTVYEIIQAKYQSILDNSVYDYIIADMFMNEDDLDLSDADHKANTGVVIVQLLPLGQVKTKEIILETSAKEFEILEGVIDGVDIYINDLKFINGKINLAEAIDSVTIKFVNTTDKPKIIKSYAIAY